jgi:two-component system, chemotaxis family, chemotaxis protein CheY
MPEKRAKVLIVDDSKPIRDALQAILEKLNFEVVGQANDGAEALQKCRTLKPDIVTLDRIMPKMDGLEALRIIKIVAPRCLVVIVTARADKGSVMECAKAGANHYLIKPFEEEKVAEVMGQVEAKLKSAPTPPKPAG